MQFHCLLFHWMFVFTWRMNVLNIGLVCTKFFMRRPGWREWYLCSVSSGYIDVGDDQHNVVTNMTVIQKVVASSTLWIKILVLFGVSIGFILPRNGEELKRTERQHQQYVYTCERPIVMCDPNPCDPNGWPPVCKWVLKPFPTYPTAIPPIIDPWNPNPMSNLPYSNNGYNNGYGQGYGYGRK